MSKGGLVIANASQYGLYGAVLTSDRDKAYKIALCIRIGAYAQNSFKLDCDLAFLRLYTIGSET